jgi:hypothetical protein
VLPGSSESSSSKTKQQKLGNHFSFLPVFCVGQR